MQFPFIIKETTGSGRAIILTGRSLPYRDVIWGGTQRVNVNWFPGSPVASAQVIGQTYKPTRIKGMWKDWLLDRSGIGGGSFGFKALPALAGDSATVRLINFPVIGPAGLPLAPGDASIVGQTFLSAASVAPQVAARARTVRDAFELIRRSGQKLRVEWGSIVRYGFLTDADYKHARDEDIGYDLEFTWTGDTDVAPRVNKLPELDPLGTIKKILQALQAVLDLLLQAFLTAFFAVLQVQQTITRIGSLITALVEVMEKFASLALVPIQVIGNIRQQLTSIAIAVNDLMATIRGVPAAYLEAANGADAAAINFAQSIAAAILFNAKVLGSDAIRQRRELERLEDDVLLGLFVSPGTVTLRDVSTRFYGTPDNWPQIQEFNGFPTSTIDRGTVVRVPKLGAGGTTTG